MGKTNPKAGARWVWWLFECDRGPLGCGRAYRAPGPLLQGEHKGVRARCACGTINFSSERGGGLDGE